MSARADGHRTRTPAPTTGSGEGARPRPVARRRTAFFAAAASAAVTVVLAGCAPDARTTPSTTAPSTTAPSARSGSAQKDDRPARLPGGTILVTDFGADTVTFVGPPGRATSGRRSVEVGTAPYGIVLGADGTAWVATAEGVAA
ncbi:hypothetical protein ACFWXJ_34130, partial [[Kitasatospora] papulosa]